MTYCTSTNCPYIKQCARQTRDDIDEVNDTYYNYEYSGCDALNGYSDYVKGDELTLVISDL